VKIVLDANTIVSGIGWDGPPRRVLLALRAGQHSLVTSPALLQEVTLVLRYPKLRQIALHLLLPVVLEWLHRPEHLVIPQERLNVTRRDPSDNLVLEAAVAGGAAAIVSGDRDLLGLKQFRSIRIVSPREFATKHLW
jgi:uncharacterized protein